MQISAVIIAFNEEANIGDAIRSVQWADEILVVDSESTDATRQIAESLGAKVVIKTWEGFSKQKQFATGAAAFDIIFSLDADERVSEPLRTEILELKGLNAVFDAYSIPRLSIYMGREVHHGGWYPDRQIRLFDRRKGAWKDRAIHESFALFDDAVLGRLNGDMLHYSVNGIQHHNKMIADRYAPLGAEQLIRDGKKPSFLKALVSAIHAFAKGYFLKLGFLDGEAGLMIAYFSAHNTLMKNLIAAEQNTAQR